MSTVTLRAIAISFVTRNRAIILRWLKPHTSGGELIAQPKPLTPTPARAEDRCAMILETTLTCPSCGAPNRATMPTDACQFFYKCGSCRQIIRPKPGDCCVFCSYSPDV